jgi:hypothetical protein
MEGFLMTGTHPFEIPNRRTSPADRRQREDRRAHARPDTHAQQENEVLHDLLREAHARIRELEQAVERLTTGL